MHHIRLTIKYKWGGENNLTPFFYVKNNYKIIKIRGDVRMSKINVGDLRELAKNEEDKRIVEHGEFKIEVEQYIPVIDKITLATSAVLSAVDEEDLVLRNNLHVATKVLIARVYSDVKLPKNNMDAYDLLISSGVYKTIESNIPANELEELMTIIGNHVKEKEDEYDRKNTIENIVSEAIEDFKTMGYTLLSKLPDEYEMGSMKDELNNLNPDNLKFITDFVKASDKASTTKVVD